MTLRKKIAEGKAAYEVLKPYVKTDEYYAHLEGLIEAYTRDGTDDKETK